MDVQTGIGTTAVAMVAIALVLVAYPILEARRLIRRGHTGTRGPELTFLAVASLMTIVGIIPASLANVGWMLVPLLIVLVSALYASVFSALVRDEGPLSAGRVAVFLGPLLVIATGSAAESVAQAATAAAGQDSVMSSWGFWSILVLTVAPPLVAGAAIIAIQLRSRRAR